MSALMALALLVAPAQAAHELSAAGPKVGDVHVLTRTYETASGQPGASSSTARGRDTIIERVVAVRSDGVELEYDLPAEASVAQRAREWRLPVRVWRPSVGHASLVDPAHVEGRIDAWLSAAGLTRASCGRWFFTWNAFQVDCDRKSALRTIATFDPGPEQLAEGFLHRDPEALAAAPLRADASGARGRYWVESPVDPEAVRRERVEADLAVAAISGDKLTADAARRARASELIEGTVRTTFEVAPALRRQVRVRTVTVRRADGRTETSTSTKTIERRPLAGPA